MKVETDGPPAPVLTTTLSAAEQTPTTTAALAPHPMGPCTPDSGRGDRPSSSVAQPSDAATTTISEYHEEETLAWQRSPVPLEAEEAENAAVRALAARLAPTLEEAAALIAASSSRSNGDDDYENHDQYDKHNDNDSLDDEVDALRYSEEALREELELASDFSNLFHRSPPRSGGEALEASRDGAILDDADDDDDDSVVSDAPLEPQEGGQTSSGPQGLLRAAVAAVVPRRLVGTTPRSSGLTTTTTAEADVDPEEPSDLPEQDVSSVTRGGTLSPISLTTITTPSAAIRKATTPDVGRSGASKASMASSTSVTALHDILIPAPALTTTTTMSSPSGHRRSTGAYTKSDHFDHLRLAREEKTWYSLDWTAVLVRDGIANEREDKEEDDNDDGAKDPIDGGSEGGAADVFVPGAIKEYCLTLPDSKLKTLFVGLPDHHVRSSTTTTGGAGASASPKRPNNDGGGPSSPARLVPTAAATTPLPRSAAATAAATPSSQTNVPGPVDLPVRTLAIRVRGDVLCGSVTDAVVHALLPSGGGGGAAGDRPLDSGDDASTLASADDSVAGATASIAATTANPPTPMVRIQKRQGGHLQAIVGGVRFASPAAPLRHRRSQPATPRSGTAATAPTSPASGGRPSPRSHPAFFLDAQLCTHRSERCERVLLLRVYHLPDPDAFHRDLAVEGGDDDEDGNRADPEDGASVESTSRSAAGSDPILIGPQEARDAEDERQCWRLREACALIQRVESPRKAKRIRLRKGSGSGGSPSATSRRDLREAVSDHLRTHYQACPSAREGGITLPALNPDDWPVVVASWRWIRAIWDELDSRDLNYHSLTSTRFGAFPALPSLDVHYCSQIRRLSREDMVVQLLRSASELEDYAREAEYACANLIALLQPAFDTYGVPPPSLPRPTALTAYPLDFIAPQQACPPWGQLVMEALNQIQSWIQDDRSAHSDGVEELWHPTALSPDEARDSLALAERAVQLVWTAFQTQDDEEKGARLGRKNLQVMDRLAKMQEHERLSLSLLDQAHLTSGKASKAADDFRAKSGGIREVPLLKWSIVVGGSTGTCLVTTRHILFVTQLIPYFGGSKSSLWKLQDVYFIVQEGGTPSLLNPLPTIISVKARGGEEVYAFRPSSGGARLKSFLDLVQMVDVEAASDISLGGSDTSSSNGRLGTV